MRILSFGVLTSADAFYISATGQHLSVSQVRLSRLSSLWNADFTSPDSVKLHFAWWPSVIHHTVIWRSVGSGGRFDATGAQKPLWLHRLR